MEVSVTSMEAPRQDLSVQFLTVSCARNVTEGRHGPPPPHPVLRHVEGRGPVFEGGDGVPTARAAERGLPAVRHARRFHAGMEYSSAQNSDMWQRM